MVIPRSPPYFLPSRLTAAGPFSLFIFFHLLFFFLFSCWSLVADRGKKWCRRKSSIFSCLVWLHLAALSRLFAAAWDPSNLGFLYPIRPLPFSQTRHPYSSCLRHPILFSAYCLFSPRPRSFIHSFFLCVSPPSSLSAAPSSMAVL